MQAHFDNLIIGAGPAGLQAGYFFEKLGRDYLIVERNATPGSFFKDYPRHRMLISINKVYTGTNDEQAKMRWDWNSLICDNPDLRFAKYSTEYFPMADDLCRYLEDFVDEYKLNIKYETEIVRVSKDDDGFILEAADGSQIRGKRLIVATGVFKPYVPDIPGIEHCDSYNDHDVDPMSYADKRVMVIGKGNSAFETAQHLIPTAAAIHICSPESVKFAWQSHFVGNLRAVNNNFLDTYQLKSQNTVIDASIDKIEFADGQYQVHLTYSHAKGQTAVIPYDKVIYCTGFSYDNSMFDESCKPDLIIYDRFPAQTAEWESANVQDLYYAGTLMQACDYRKTMSGFIHGFRHNIESLINVFETKYYGNPWPSEVIELTPEALLKKAIYHVNTGPGMFLQPGFLADVIVVEKDNSTANYYQDIRADFVHDSHFGQSEDYYTVTLEYGGFLGDPFSVERDPDPDAGDRAPYLHPIIRRYSFGKLVAEYHINDDLESQWDREIYTRPALKFFEKQLSGTAEAKMAMR